MLELVQAELDDIIGLLGHLGGTRDGLPEGLNDVPAEIVNAIRREIETVQDLHHRGGVISEADITAVRTTTVMMALLMGRRLGKLEATVGPLSKIVTMADYTAITAG